MMFECDGFVFFFFGLKQGGNYLSIMAKNYYVAHVDRAMEQ